MGFWKGSGLAILLDTFAAILADGQDTLSLNPSRPASARFTSRFNQDIWAVARQASARANGAAPNCREESPEPIPRRSARLHIESAARPKVSTFVTTSPLN